LVGKAGRVPALALLLLLCGPKCCSYSMNPGEKIMRVGRTIYVADLRPFNSTVDTADAEAVNIVT